MTCAQYATLTTKCFPRTAKNYCFQITCLISVILSFSQEYYFVIISDLLHLMLFYTVQLRSVSCLIAEMFHLI